MYLTHNHDIYANKYRKQRDSWMKGLSALLIKGSQCNITCREKDQMNWDLPVFQFNCKIKKPDDMGKQKVDRIKERSI